MARMSGRVALVTGATGGIGRATAARFLAEGASVMLTDLDEGPLVDLARALGDRCRHVAGDVSVESDVERIVGACTEAFGGLDVLFANAGTEGKVAPLSALTVEAFDRVLAVNVRGVWLCIKHAAPVLRPGGAIVVTSSVAGLMGSPGVGAYVASKHAVIGLAKTAALELAPAGIRVNCVNPGPVDNRMMRSIEEQAAPGAAATVKQGFLNRVPLKRYATNEEVANLVLFLASDESSCCTGGVYAVDGGFLAG